MTSKVGARSWLGTILFDSAALAPHCYAPLTTTTCTR